MTVVVGFVGPDGAVMASDSQASEEDQSQHDTEKIWTSGELLCGYSGYGAVKEPLIVSLEAALEAHGKKLTRWEAKELIQRAVRPVLDNAYGHFIGTRPEEHAGKIAGTLLVIGHDDGGYWLLEVNYNNIASFYNETAFHTIGSGAIAAQVARGLLQHYEPKGRPVGHLKLLAYRTVQTCINTLGGNFGVGGKTQLWYSENGGEFVKASIDELEATENSVGSWTLVEQESIDKAFPRSTEQAAAASTTEDPPEPPKKDTGAKKAADA